MHEHWYELVILAVVASIIGGTSSYLIKRKIESCRLANIAIQRLTKLHAFKLSQKHKDVKRSVSLVSHELRTVLSEMHMVLDSMHSLDYADMLALKGQVVQSLSRVNQLRYITSDDSLTFMRDNRKSLAKIVNTAVYEVIQSCTKSHRYVDPGIITFDDDDTVTSMPIEDIPYLQELISAVLRKVCLGGEEAPSMIRIAMSGRSTEKNSIHYSIEITTDVVDNNNQVLQDIIDELSPKIRGILTEERINTKALYAISVVAEKQLMVPDKQDTFIISDTPAAEYKGGALNVVLVEDNPTISAITNKMLTDLGASVASFDNGTDAFAYIQEYPSNIDILISDIYMPGLSGFELVKKLFSTPGLTVNFPVVVITASSENNELQTMLGLGADLVLTKPITKSKLAVILEECT